MWTQSQEAADLYRIRHIPRMKGEIIKPGFVSTGGGNSGYQALSLAMQWGCDPIILVGFTMGYDGQRKHWHADHKGNNPRPEQLASWARNFAYLNQTAGDRIKIYGQSAIQGFARVSEL